MSYVDLDSNANPRPVAGHIYTDEHGWAPIDEPDTIEGTVVAEHTEFYPEAVRMTLAAALAEASAKARSLREALSKPTLTRGTWVAKRPDPRLRTPNGDNPIFDELDARRETKTRKGWTKSKHRYRVRMTRWQEQHQLEEGAHRDRLWEIEHASPLLNQL